MQPASNILEKYPALRKRAAEAEQRRLARDSAHGEIDADLPQAARLHATWSDDRRGLPNVLLRSALFNARNRRQKRVLLKQVDVYVVHEESRITYSGEELRQDDQTVWLELLNLARREPLGTPIEFTPYSLCKAIRWQINGRSYKRLRECLTRMQATAVEVYSNRLKGGVSMSMIPIFRWKDHVTGKALTRYQVTLAPELVELFGNGHFTRIKWEQRLNLPDGIATWLHGYYASHRDPIPILLEEIAKGAGLTTEKPKKVRELIRMALASLEAVGFLKQKTPRDPDDKAWRIARGRVYVSRA